jgi:hypothetical protein
MAGRLLAFGKAFCSRNAPFQGLSRVSVTPTEVRTMALFDTAHYRLTLTLRGVDSGRGVLLRSSKMKAASFRLQPRKMTINHIMKRDMGDRTYA